MSMLNIDTTDTSLRRITITEDVDLDLDKLLLGDNSGAEAAPDDAPSSPLPTNKTEVKTHQGAPTSPIFALEEEEEDDDDDDEKDGGLGHWVLPEPAKPGDHIASTMKKVPSKSILKKTSSYGNFDTLQTSGTSKSLGGRKSSSFLSFNNMLDISSNSIGSSSGRQNRNQVGIINDPLDTSGGRKYKRTKQTSYTSIASLNSVGSGGSRGSAIGWDLDDSSGGNVTPRSPSGSKFVVDVPLPPSMPTLKSSEDDGISDSKHSVTSLSNSCTPRIRRNVSFHSVELREYDRTIGDNPSCRSGPPLSLDWSYSKKYEKNLEEYEAQRSSERVSSLSKLHVNKYKRRNLLAFHWGHSEDEMKEARGNTKKIQRQRSMTQLMLPISMCEEAVLSLKSFVSKRKKKGVVDNDVWSDMSNSASTKDTTHRDSPRLPRQDTGLPQRKNIGLQDSCHTA